MRFKRLKGIYRNGNIVREFETTKELLEYNYKYDRDLYDNIINDVKRYYFLAKNYNSSNISLYIVRYDEDNEDFYSEYITEYSQNDKDMFKKASERIKGGI